MSIAPSSDHITHMLSDAPGEPFPRWNETIKEVKKRGMLYVQGNRHNEWLKATPFQIYLYGLFVIDTPYAVAGMSAPFIDPDHKTSHEILFSDGMRKVFVVNTKTEMARQYYLAPVMPSHDGPVNNKLDVDTIVNQIHADYKKFTEFNGDLEKNPDKSLVD